LREKDFLLRRFVEKYLILKNPRDLTIFVVVIDYYLKSFALNSLKKSIYGPNLRDVTD